MLLSLDHRFKVGKLQATGENHQALDECLDDSVFMEAWQKGDVSCLIAFFRLRQTYRAKPGLRHGRLSPGLRSDHLPIASV